MSESKRILRLAAIQMCSGQDLDRNLRRAVEFIHAGADRGADVVALPENFAFMGSDRERADVAQELDGQIVTELRKVARQRSVILLAGSYLERSRQSGDTRPFNTSVLFDRQGEIVAVYRKLYLFDVCLADGSSYRESEYIQPGSEVVVARTEGVSFGLSICYDLRFPELYRVLALRGARVVFVPAAFTLLTGKDHWIPLLRARAIENQISVVAPAQYGLHEAHRQTYGHAAIVDSWGTVLTQAPEQECVVCADVDFAYQEDVRRRIPVFEHLRMEVFEQAFQAAARGGPGAKNRTG